ncbi:MAG: hypothetical protein HYU86_10550 [Chloroflexi bacterium]|nr:hypothetical protein [Chloroflexota bacterium]
MPVALIYANSYRVGMSSLDFQTIYGLFYHGVVCERVFWDEGSLPPISLESQRPLDDFPLIAFSISFELDYLRAVLILRASGIPLFAAERREGHPLIIGRGPCLTPIQSL